MRMGSQRVHLFLLFVFVFGVSLFKIRNPDLGFHLVSGRYLLETLSFPRLDFATFTRFGLPDYPHSVGPSVLFYLLYKLGGFPLMGLFKSLVYASTFSFIYLATATNNKKETQPALNLSLLLLVGSVAAVLCRDRLALQPFMFTDLCLALLLFELPKIKEDPFRWRRLLIFSLIFLMWFNAHLGVIHGIAIFSLFLCTLILNRTYGNTFHIFKMYGAIIVLTGVLSALANPSSANIWPHLFFEVQNSIKQHYVAEYQSGVFAYGRPIMLMIGVAGIFGFFAFKSPNVPRTRHLFPVSVFVFFLALTLKYQREISHLAMAWFLVCGHFIRCIALDKPHKGWSCSIVIGVTLILFLELHYPALAFGVGLHSRAVPKNGFLQVQKNLNPQRLYNSLSLGGWWTFFYQEQFEKLKRDEHAAGKIFHDGRGPLFNKTFFQESVLPILRGEPRGQLILDAYDVDLVLLSYFDPLCSYFARQPQWKLSYFDEAMSVFSRTEGGKKAPFSMINPCVDDAQVWQQWEKWSANERQEFAKQVQAFKMQFPQNPRILFIEGILESKQSHFAESSKRFFESAEAGDIFDNAYGNAGKIACTMGQYSLADLLFKKAETLMVAEPGYWNEWTTCLHQQHRNIRAAIEWAKGQVYMAYFAFRT